MSTTDKSDTQAALDFANRNGEARILTTTFEGKEEQILICRDANGDTNREAVRDLLSEYASAPDRRKGSIVVHDVASFVALVNRDKRPDSLIFCDVGARQMTAVLDFHGPADSSPRFGQDRVTYGFTLSPQLLAWMKSAAAPMDQKTFSRLIDDRLGDIGGEVLEKGSLAEQFAVRRGIMFANVADLVVFTRTIAAKSATDSTEVYDENTGSTSIQYAKRNDVKTPDGAPVAVPYAFVLRIPVLNGLGATEYNIAVRLRFDVGDKGIAWRVELHALDKYIQAAIEEALAIVRKPAPDGCGLPVCLAAIPA